VADVAGDHATSGLEWGEYALLYRTHRIGQQLETQLIEAGIPCRVARGQALCDDELIGFVISSLRVVRDPRDPVALDGFAEKVLPYPLLQQVRVRFSEVELLAGFRGFARENRGDPDARMAWRFVFHVENLAGLGRAHEHLDSLVEELLSQRVGRYRNPLDERAEELSDPVGTLERALRARFGARLSFARNGQIPEGSGRTIVFTFNAFFDSEQARALHTLLGEDGVLCALRSPYDATLAPGHAALLSYCDVPVSLDAVAAVLAGERQATGQLPVRI